MDQEFISQTALDQMVSNDQAQMLKAAIPYLPARGQQVLSIYTKVQELSNALALFSPAGQSEQMQAASLPVTDPLEMLQDIRRFCYGGSRQKLDRMVNLLAMAEMFRMMNENPEKKG